MNGNSSQISQGRASTRYRSPNDKPQIVWNGIRETILGLKVRGQARDWEEHASLPTGKK
jgi:hypothetical protein